MNAGSDDSEDSEDRAPGCRLFFALWPDTSLRNQLDNSVMSLLPARAGRLVPLENLHLTLVFLGDIPASRLACIEQAAARLRTARFELVLDRIAWWRQSQVLWLGPTETPAALAAHVAALREELAACELPTELRQFSAHMTLMRKVRRRPPPRRFDPLVWKPDGHVLIESTPIAGGVRYQRLAFWPFA